MLWDTDSRLVLEQDFLLAWVDTPVSFLLSAWGGHPASTLRVHSRMEGAQPLAAQGEVWDQGDPAPALRESAVWRRTQMPSRIPSVMVETAVALEKLQFSERRCHPQI